MPTAAGWWTKGGRNFGAVLLAVAPLILSFVSLLTYLFSVGNDRIPRVGRYADLILVQHDARRNAARILQNEPPRYVISAGKVGAGFDANDADVRPIRKAVPPNRVDGPRS
jgi:hypothetical protein